MAKWDDDIVQALVNLGGSAGYDDIYAQIENIRPELPESWKAIVRRRIQDLSSDSAGFKYGEDLFFSVEGLGSGVWGLRSQLKPTPPAIDLSLGVEEPGKVLSSTYRVLRDTALARKIKLLHKNKCQLCGMAVQIGDGESYAEAHHIIPLGAPHNGPDTPGNIIVLCPNHHVLCDYGGITLDLTNIRHVHGHYVSSRSVLYHNEKIAKNGV